MTWFVKLTPQIVNQSSSSNLNISWNQDQRSIWDLSSGVSFLNRWTENFSVPQREIFSHSPSGKTFSPGLKSRLYVMFLTICICFSYNLWKKCFFLLFFRLYLFLHSALHLLLSMCYYGNMIIYKESSNFSIISNRFWRWSKRKS